MGVCFGFSGHDTKLLFISFPSLLCPFFSDDLSCKMYLLLALNSETHLPLLPKVLGFKV